MDQETTKQRQKPTKKPMLQLTFFDVVTQMPVYPEGGTVEIKAASNTFPYPLPKRDKESGNYLIPLAEDLKGKPAEIRYCPPPEPECQPYMYRWVGLTLGTCCPVPIPLFPSEQSCTFIFCAYNSSLEDCTKNPHARLNGAEVKITHVVSPEDVYEGAAELCIDENQNLKIKRPARKSTSRSISQATYSGKTVNGCVEIPGVLCHRLYKVEFSAKNHVLDEQCSSPVYRYICCEERVALEALFQPCRHARPKALMFVRHDCPEMPMKNLPVQVNGEHVVANEIGILELKNLKQEITETLFLKQQGMILTPSIIHGGAHHEPIEIVKVAEVEMQTEMVRVLFVDDEGQPQPHRKFLVQGDSTVQAADHDGVGLVRAGSIVHALETEFAFASEPLMISNKSES